MDHDESLLNAKFEKYVDDIQNNVLTKTGKLKRLSAVKVLILRTLWQSGSSFPRNWVSSARLNEVTKQKYFDRRVRELRNQLGCDIETGMNEGTHAYRLFSDTISEAFDRTYLTDKQRQQLFRDNNLSCAACGQTFSPETISGLQADHKVPLIRGGGSEITNWQPLCVSCNVAKRRSCQGCKADCQACAWAFPEIFGQTVPLQLSQDMGAKLQALARQRSTTIHALILEAIQRLVESALSDGEL